MNPVRRVELFFKRIVTAGGRHCFICDSKSAWLCYCCGRIRARLRGEPPMGPTELRGVLDRRATMYVFWPRVFRPPYWVKVNHQNLLVYADNMVHIATATTPGDRRVSVKTYPLHFI